MPLGLRCLFIEDPFCRRRHWPQWLATGLLFFSAAAFGSEGGTFYLEVTKTSAGADVLKIEERPGHLPTLIGIESFRSLDEARAAAQPSHPSPTKQFSNLKITEVPGQSLWTVRNEWSWDWEKKYSDWIQSEFNVNFFGIDLATDCADAIYAARWIFARQFGLPAANHLGGSGVVMSQETMKSEWASLPTDENWRKDKRFLAALDYLLQLTYTEILMEDSYPIAIKAESLFPGAHFSYIYGHNLLVTQLRSGEGGEAPLVTMNSTTPRGFRRLAVSEFLDPNQPVSGGFSRFRWPERRDNQAWALRAAESMPFYSREQFSPQFVEEDLFDEAVNHRVASKYQVSPEKKMYSLLGSVYAKFQDRKLQVEEGARACFPNRCPQGSRNYFDFSTPERDLRILSQIQQVDGWLAKYPNLQRSFDLFTWNNTIEVDGEYFRTYTFRLSELMAKWRTEHYSSDPNVSRNHRWGID